MKLYVQKNGVFYSYDVLSIGKYVNLYIVYSNVKHAVR